MRKAVRRWCVATAILLSSAAIRSDAGQGSAAPASAPDMVARIFSGEFATRLPPPAEWFDDGRAYLVPERSASGGVEIVRYDTATGAGREVLISAADLTPAGRDRPLEVEGLQWSNDRQRVLLFTNTRRVWRTNSRGDYWVLDRAARTLRQLGGASPEASLMYASFNADATKVAYVRANDLYVEDVKGGGVKRLTSDGSALVINGGSDWVNEEELDLHDCYRWSPDGRQIAFLQFDLHGVGNFSLQYYLGSAERIVTQIPYPDPGPYPVNMSVPYPLAGTTNSAVRMGIVNAGGGSPRWLDVPGDAREHYLARFQWLDRSTMLVQQLNRRQNVHAIYTADSRTGRVRPFWRDEDAAFITIGFGGLPAAQPSDDQGGLVVISEKDGWMHAYHLDRDGHDTLVTRGDFDVVALSGIDRRRQRLYFIASPGNATERYLFSAPLDGSSPPLRVTPAGADAGTHNYSISPDGEFAFHAYSSLADPGTRALVRLPGHEVVRELGRADALAGKVAAEFGGGVEFVKADAGDGVMVDGYLMTPPGFDPARKYPVLVYIYGEPASQTVTNVWGGATALFHRHLASLGYVVASFDNAGTPAPRGRDWRKAIHGAVGVLSSRQQAAALRSLAASRAFIDLDRVAVWGWSGGGTNTLNLMFRAPELYRVGMAVAPAPDQRLYDTIYQERYMGLPRENVEGYRRASAINVAEGLRGSLLIVHGSGDDNVHYQGTQLLVNRLVELGKPFDLMTYPDRTHSISEGPGTTVHLYTLLRRYLTEHLPAGPR